MYDYDSFGTLVCASLDMSECLFKTPDIIGNVYRDRDARGRVYDRSGRLLKDEKNYYRYDGEGNLILKSTRNVLEPPVMPQPKDWLDKLFTRTTPNDKDLQAVSYTHLDVYKRQYKDWRGSISNGSIMMERN